MGFIEYARGDYLVEEFSSVVNGTLVINEDELIKIYPFSSGRFIFSLLTFYFTILLLGTKLMVNSKPFDLRKYMIAYNALQVSMCTLYLYAAFVTMPANELLSFLYNNVCRPVGLPYDSPYRIYALHGAALYTVMKITDLTDTVFMVLRKQYQHITVLHLFHHTTMVVSMWYQLAYVRGELGAVFGLINIFVHVIMYSYYLMSSLGSPFKDIVQPYKKYVTLIQIGQFAIILSVLGVLAWNGCEMPPTMWNLWLFNNLLFFVLFLNFFIRNFIMKKKTHSE